MSLISRFLSILLIQFECGEFIQYQFSNVGNKQRDPKTANGENKERDIYHTGNLIVPQKYGKVMLKNGQLLTEEIQVSGRKIPLRNIHTTMLQKREKYMRVRTDSE